MSEAFFGAVLGALCEPDPARKRERVGALQLPAPALFDAEAVVVPPGPLPGRPARPALVAPREVPSRGLGSREGRIALVHAVAHIEFNAINLALDALQRFRGLPRDYYADWLGVAQDEARHFALLRERLQQLGADYGDLPAHNGLWEAAEKTAHDGLLRMALVPRVLEARGLDVTPGMIGRLREVGDADTVAILERILAEEVGHVAVGSRWFAWWCAQRGENPRELWPRLLAAHGVRLRPPLNHPARVQAGFDATELHSALD